MPKALPILDSRFTFGADPELFIFDGDNRPVPAGRFIPGTKQEPYKVRDGAVQRDGFAAEFNIDPVQSFEEFDRKFTSVIYQMRGMIPNDHTLKAVPYVVFDEEIFNSADDLDKVLGCDPDYNAWENSVNLPPDTSETPFARCAGGHLHIGWDKNQDIGDWQHISLCQDLVKQLDWYLGAWGTIKDKDLNRRTLYGKAGAYRAKPYGVEYRVLSNFWVLDSSLRLSVWNRLQKAISDMANNFHPELFETASDVLRLTIDRGMTFDESFKQRHYKPLIRV